MTDAADNELEATIVKAYVLIGIGLAWVAGLILFVASGPLPSIELGQAHPTLSLLAVIFVSTFLQIGWMVPLSIGVLRLRNERVLTSGNPPPAPQRRFNWVVLLVLAACGTLFGLWGAYACAKIPSGYVAEYSFMGAFMQAVFAGVLGLPFLVYWRTRWLGLGFLAAGLLSLASFYGGIAALIKLDRVAWRHEELVRFGPDQEASAVIYFCQGVSDDQIEEFRVSVLEPPAEPRYLGKNASEFVGSYLRLVPNQANGYDGVALTFRGNPSPDEVGEYIRTIEADQRVKMVFRDIAPSSIRVQKNSTTHDHCR